MTETPHVVTRIRRGEAGAKDFQLREQQIRRRGGLALQEYRQKAWEAYQKLPMPTVQEEAWRRTDLRHLRADSLRLIDSSAQFNFQQVDASLLRPLVQDNTGGQIILQGAQAEVKVNPALEASGIIFTDLVTAEERYPELLDRLISSRGIQPDEGKFAALVGAFAQNGVVLYVPKGVQLEQPLHSVLWAAGIDRLVTSHILVWLEENASVTYIHESASPTEASGQLMHAGIVDLYVGPGAKLHFVELQSWGEHVWNFSHERVRVDRNATADWIFGAIGSHLTKNFSDVSLVGEGSTGRMSGFYFTDNDQHLDHDTQQNHLARNTTSDLLFKGALLDESRSVWQGMIYVAPEAQKTDGYQANRNLILSPKARADSIPGLEILADDVRCTHGATVGQIDQDQIFYLRSRGIEQKIAEQLIVEGFYDPIMQRIPFEGVRERFQQAIHDKMRKYSG